MDKYLLKYKKYKTKYLNLLKKQIGGSNIFFNLDRYKPLFRRFIFELNYEISFSLDYDSNDNLISQFIKGITFNDDENELEMMHVPLFKKNICFTHIHCHTHDNYSVRKIYRNFSPPSANDYLLILNYYFKYNTQLFLIFAPEGIYEISLGENLLDELEQDEYYDAINLFLPMSRQFNSYKNPHEWQTFRDRIHYDTNMAHILLSKPLEFELSELETKQREFRERYPGLPDINTLEDYSKVIRFLGFNINFYRWEEELNINLTIPKYIHDFLNATIKAKQQGFLSDILFFNKIEYETNADEYLTTELNENNYVDITNKSTDEIFNIATAVS